MPQTTPNAPHIGPVWELQAMLRTLAAVNWSLPFLTPDGVFGETTLEAVMTFQRENGLPVTGVVDRETWGAIVRRFIGIDRAALAGEPFFDYESGGGPISPQDLQDLLDPDRFPALPLTLGQQD